MEILKRKLSDDHNVLLAYVFGSKVAAKAWRGSDVDVAVLLKDNSWGEVSKLLDEVADALKVSVDKVDLVDLSKADDVLKSEVIKNGYKMVDRGFQEEKLREKLYSTLPETMRLLDSYLDNSGNPIKRDILTRKLMALDEEVNVLETHILSKPVEQIKEDPVAKRVLRDSLRVAIESALDVCKHIVASRRLGTVEDYKDFPLKLAEAGALSSELGDKLADYAKLRNIIVHRYVELDYALLYRKAEEFVKTIAPSFREQLVRLLQSAKREEKR